MPINAIDTAPDPFSAQTVSLDGVSYVLRLQYNQREACYYLSITDVTLGTDIVSGIKLVSNYPLIRRYDGGDIVGLPPGELIAFSNTPDDSPADIGQLGLAARVTLLYLDATYLATGN